MDQALRKVIDDDQRIVMVDAATYSLTAAPLSIAEIGPERSLSGRAEKWITWGQLTIGDCALLAGSKLIIRDNGTTHWSGVTWSRDSNDTWEQRFIFYASNGFPLFVLPAQDEGDSWYFHKMPNKETQYPWEQSNWIFDPTKWAAVSKASLSYRC